MIRNLKNLWHLVWSVRSLEQHIKELEEENAALRALGSPTPPEEVYANYDKWLTLDWSEKLSKSIDQVLQESDNAHIKIYKLHSGIIEIEEAYKREHPMHVSSETLTKIKEFA